MSAPSPAVLLVEDDPTNQLIALSMLRHLGIEADAASDGRAGVQHASQRDYDVVLMDIQMPAMDGVEAMKAIRALLPPERCPRIVAVTAHAVTGTREQMLATGFDAFYDKPLSIALLRSAVTVPAPPESSVVSSAPARPTMIVRAPRPDHAAMETHATETILEAVRGHVREMLGEDDEAFMVDLVSAFAESSHQVIRDVAQARADRDAQAMARAAHKLKGSAANVGLDRLTERWDEVETAIRQGSADVFGGSLDETVAETAQTVTRLETAVAGLG